MTTHPSSQPEREPAPQPERAPGAPGEAGGERGADAGGGPDAAGGAREQVGADAADGASEEVEEVLQGGVANAEAVVRVGDHVLRPSNRHSEAVHRFLSLLRQTGFEGAPVPIGIDPDGRERLVFIEGEVPIPRYPAWAQTDTALASLVELVKRFHRASMQVRPPGDDWNPDGADPAGGTFLCHNDICLENVVFRDGEAVALLDFEFVAPGRPVFELTAFSRMTVPIDDQTNASRLGWDDVDRPTRLRLIADTYGLSGDERLELMSLLDRELKRTAEFTVRKVEAGEPGYVKMWEAMGGMERFDRRWRWWTEQRPTFLAALTR